MTAEEILKKHNKHHEYSDFLPKEYALKAMEEYAEQRQETASEVDTIVMPHELNTVELAYKTLVWMIHSGRFDNYKASDIRKKLNEIYGEEIMQKVIDKYAVA